MDTFNVICGLATIASLLLTMWMYWEGKRKEAVERERMAHIISRLRDLLSIATAAEQQATLLAGIADREETPKKELKHLAVGTVITINALQKSLSEELRSREKFGFGIPSAYLVLQNAPKPNILKGEASPAPRP